MRGTLLQLQPIFGDFGYNVLFVSKIEAQE